MEAARDTGRARRGMKVRIVRIVVIDRGRWDTEVDDWRVQPVLPYIAPGYRVARCKVQPRATFPSETKHEARTISGHSRAGSPRIPFIRGR
jgi:hypothetical protein